MHRLLFVVPEISLILLSSCRWKLAGNTLVDSNLQCVGLGTMAVICSTFGWYYYLFRLMNFHSIRIQKRVRYWNAANSSKKKRERNYAFETQKKKAVMHSHVLGEQLKKNTGAYNTKCRTQRWRTIFFRTGTSPLHYQDNGKQNPTTSEISDLPAYKHDHNET